MSRLRRTWNTTRGIRQGQPFEVDVNIRVGEQFRRPTHSICVSVVVPLRKPDGFGRPEGEEAAELDAIEELLVEGLTMEQPGIFVLTGFARGECEFVFYDGNAASAEAVVERVTGRLDSHEIRYTVFSDPRWSYYKQAS